LDIFATELGIQPAEISAAEILKSSVMEIQSGLEWLWKDETVEQNQR